MNPQERRQWLNTLLNLNELIILKVYEDRKVKKLKAMAELARENQVKGNLPNAIFMYKGVWYSYPYNAVIPTIPLGVPRSLDPSLMYKAVDIMDESFEEKRDISYVDAMIKNALDLCRTSACLKKLIPGKLWPTGTVVEYTIGDVLTKEEVDNFNFKNVKGLDAVKSLYMMELLMAKVGT